MSIDRIAALLAKAERTDNAAEADAYLMKAQSLATAASIDLAVARARTDKKESRQEPEMRTVSIGEKGKRANQHLISLFVAVAHNNDAHVDVASNSTFVLAYGMPSDLDVIEALFSSLAVQMIAASQQWLAIGLWRDESYQALQKSGGRTRRLVKPHTSQTARAAFYRAYIARIAERLAEARSETMSAAVKVKTETGGVDRALVIREKTAEIRDFHRSASSARGAWSGYSGAMRGDGGSSGSAGRRAASLARLSSQRALTGSKAVEGSPS